MLPFHSWEHHCWAKPDAGNDLSQVLQEEPQLSLRAPIPTSSPQGLAGSFLFPGNNSGGTTSLPKGVVAPPGLQLDPGGQDHSQETGPSSL